MDLLVVEVGPIPTNDPTLEEGAVMVKRSHGINFLVAHYSGTIATEEPDLTEELRLFKAQQMLLHALAKNICTARTEPTDVVGKYINCITDDIYVTMGLDTAKYKVYSTFSMTQANILVVVYGILYETQGGLH